MLVCNAMKQDTPLRDAIIDFAAGERTDWTPDDWQALLDMLDDTRLTVDQLMGT